MYSTPTIPNSPVPVEQTALVLPFIDAKVRAGFPSPAADFAVARIDLAKELIIHPQCTFILRLQGDSMIGAGMFDGDLLVVDKYLRPNHGDIVVAEVDGEFTCKRLFMRNDMLILQPENPTYPDIRPKPGQTVEIWGVVTSCVKRFRKA